MSKQFAIQNNSGKQQNETHMSRHVIADSEDSEASSSAKGRENSERSFELPVEHELEPGGMKGIEGASPVHDVDPELGHLVDEGAYDVELCAPCGVGGAAAGCE